MNNSKNRMGYVLLTYRFLEIKIMKFTNLSVFDTILITFEALMHIPNAFRDPIVFVQS